MKEFGQIKHYMCLVYAVTMNMLKEENLTQAAFSALFEL